jgi:hypothetical protein
LKSICVIIVISFRFETEGVARIDEIEREKGKVGQRLSEAEETISALHEKLAALEKSKVNKIVQPRCGP